MLRKKSNFWQKMLFQTGVEPIIIVALDKVTTLNWRIIFFDELDVFSNAYMLILHAFRYGCL